MPGSALSFVKIFVADLDRSSAFYSRAFGLFTGQHVATPEFDECILRPADGNGGSLVLCQRKDGRDLSHGNANGPIGFIVDAVDGVHDAVIHAGGVSRMKPVDFGAARVAFVRDPDGHAIELLAPQGANRT
ncbi:VOC family protein [Sphingomonas aestuarii]